MKILVFLFLLIVIGLIIFIYNSLIAKKNNVENAYGSIDVMLKKRYDLIPKLKKLVDEYTEYEEDTLKDITELRTQVLEGDVTKEEELELNNQISDKMNGIIVAVEDYPELKANENFLNLQRNLNEIESQIAAARRNYNMVVTTYNNALEMFPSNIIASFLDYERKTVFVATDEVRDY